MAVAITPVPDSFSASDVENDVAHDLAAEYVPVGRNPAMEETVTIFPRSRALQARIPPIDPLNRLTTVGSRSFESGRFPYHDRMFVR
jgi:hypothetical protein